MLKRTMNAQGPKESRRSFLAKLGAGALALASVSLSLSLLRRGYQEQKPQNSPLPGDDSIFQPARDSHRLG